MKLALIAPIVLLAGCGFEPHPYSNYAKMTHTGAYAPNANCDYNGCSAPLPNAAEVRKLANSPKYKDRNSCPWKQGSDACYNWTIAKMDQHNAEYKEEHKGDQQRYPHMSEDYVMHHLPQLQYQNCLGQLHDASGPYAAYMIPSC
jgi:uncharacterized protein YgiB involved in biofilm formation